MYASLALNAAYNNLFLIYVALFSASLFAFVLAYTSIKPQALRSHSLPGLPRRGPALFMFASGVVTLLVWLGPLLGALVQGRPPDLLGSSTAMVTHALDLGIITPATILSGGLILRRAPQGYPDRLRSARAGDAAGANDRGADGEPVVSRGIVQRRQDRRADRRVQHVALAAIGVTIALLRNIVDFESVEVCRRRPSRIFFSARSGRQSRPLRAEKGVSGADCTFRTRLRTC